MRMNNKKHHEEKEADPEEINETKAEAVATPGKHGADIS